MNWRKAFSLAFAAMLVVSLLPALGLAQEPAAPAAVEVDPLIYEQLAASPDGQADYFIQFRATADLSPAYDMNWHDRGYFVVETLQATAEASQANVTAWLEAQGIEYTSFWINNSLFVHAGEATLNALMAFPEVAGFRGNHVYQIFPEEAAAPSPQDQITAPAYPWNITFPMADQVHSTFGITGQGVVVGGMDTGVQYDHMGLVENYRGNLGGGSFDHTYSWYDPENACGGTPCDTHGHGTATHGIMTGDDDPALPDGAWIGMAPDAQWIHCLGCPGGSCPPADTTACAQWFLAPGGDPDMRPQVVNHSWGTWSANNCNGNAFQAELMAYRAADILPAFAAGNVGDTVVPPHCYASTSPANNTDPAGNPIAFSSGAHGSTGTINSYSSGGPSACNTDNLFPDVAAPGSGSCTTQLGNTYYCGFGGTSSASPHTAGCVALVRSANPSLTVDEVEQIIRDAANDVDDGCGTPPETPDWNNIYGEGHLDCYEAVQMAMPQQGHLEFAPPSIHVTLQMGDSTTEPGVLSNVGSEDAFFEIIEQEGGFAPALAFTPPVAVPTGEAFTPEGASSPDAITQPTEPRINQLSILHVATTSTGQSVERALNELGYPYDYINSTDWTTIDFSPYDIVIVGMDGGGMTAASVQKVRTDVIDQGKRLIFMGGTCWYDFAVGVNDYLVLNDINDYCWSISASPQWTLVDPSHPLAQGLPDTYDYNTSSAGYYATRALDPDLEVVAVNGDGYDDFFYKNINFPSMGRAPNQMGDLIWFINSVYEGYWADQSDFEMLRQLIDNAINMAEADVPWVSEDPISGTVPAYSSMGIDVTFDAGVPEVDQPGDYYATLRFINDTPYGPLNVPVTMTVLPAADYGRLTGVVAGLGYCDDDYYPIEGAEVLIDGGVMTLTTDVDGVYGIWLQEGDYTVQAMAPGHQDSDVVNVTITALMTSTVDFDLRSLEPCVSATPLSMEVWLTPDTSTTELLVLMNDGAAPTLFEIRETTETISIYQNLPVYVPPTIMAQPYGGESYAGGGYQVPDGSGGIDVSLAPKRYKGPDDLVYYSDRATFDADHPGLPVEGFENTLVPDGSIVGCNGPFDNATDNACFAPGGILDGIRLMNTIPANLMVVIGDGALGQPSALVGPDTFTDDHDITFFNGDVYAVGFDLWAPLGAATFDIYIYGPGDVLLGQTSVLAAVTGTFWGVYSDAPITRIRTESVAGDGELFDDIAFGGVALGVDVPWLSEDPVDGTIAADGSVDVDVTFTAFSTMTLGTYEASLIVETEDAMVPEIWVPVTMHIVECVPVGGADFVWAPAEPVADETVTFTGSVEMGDEPIEYLWSFDDGGSGGGEVTSHAFEAAGTYTVVMTATNCGGEFTSVAEHAVTIGEAPGYWYYLPIVLTNYE
jgi:PKD repeat protein